MHEYKCEILRVIDGDTVDVDIDLGFGVWMRKERVRIHGIDTPESRTRDKEEKIYGLAAKEFVKSYLKAGSDQFGQQSLLESIMNLSSFLHLVFLWQV